MAGLAKKSDQSLMRWTLRSVKPVTLPLPVPLARNTSKEPLKRKGEKISSGELTVHPLGEHLQIRSWQSCILAQSTNCVPAGQASGPASPP